MVHRLDTTRHREEHPMASYLSLINWTDQGIRNVKDAGKRIDNFKKAVEAAGGRVIFFYLLMGEYDLATLIEVPDDATATRLLLETGRLGNIRSNTLRAFTEQEARDLTSGLS